jgi:hypothetical protein
MNCSELHKWRHITVWKEHNFHSCSHNKSTQTAGNNWSNSLIPWMTEKLITAYARVLNSADSKLEENMHWKKLINIVLQNSKANTVCSAWIIKTAHTHTKVKAEGKVVPVTV